MFKSFIPHSVVAIIFHAVANFFAPGPFQTLHIFFGLSYVSSPTLVQLEIFTEAQAMNGLAHSLVAGV